MTSAVRPARLDRILQILWGVGLCQVPSHAVVFTGGQIRRTVRPDGGVQTAVTEVLLLLPQGCRYALILQRGRGAEGEGARSHEGFNAACAVQRKVNGSSRSCTREMLSSSSKFLAPLAPPDL